MSDNNLINTFTRGRSRLLQLARRLLDSPEDAEDALQEAFCRLWPRADSLRNQAEAEKLASTVVKNISIDQLRRQPDQLTVDVETLSEDTRFSTETEQEQREQYEVVSRLIAQRLTPLQQRILRGHDMEGRSYEEIAQREGMQEAAVRMQLSRARKTIRECYHELEK